jgi:hypothetical protein
MEKADITQSPSVFSLLSYPHLASPCGTWRAGRPLPRDFLAPQHATCRVWSELPSLREGRPFCNDFGKFARALLRVKLLSVIIVFGHEKMPDRINPS